MGMPSRRCRRDPDSNVTHSYCFEELCTRSTAQKDHGTFYSIVGRKIGGLNIIMAGEVDCSTGMSVHPSAVDSLLIPIL
jgi:hypothetical protein